MIPKFEAQKDDFDDLRLIGFDKTKLENTNHLDRMIHFFLYDYKFDRVWKNPDTDLEKLKRYRAVLSPDFSMYVEMAPVLAALQYVSEPLVRRLFCVQGNPRRADRQLGKRKYV